MKSDRMLAAVCLIAIAIIVFGMMIEKFWDCRITKKLTESECLFTAAPYTVP